MIYAVTISTKNRRTLSAPSRTVVLDALRHFHGRRYELIAACIMPDHVHFLWQPWPKDREATGEPVFWSLSELLASIKSFTVHEIDRLEHTKGSVWEKESFDRFIRSDHDLQEKFDYILRNPWDAKNRRTGRGLSLGLDSRR
ncbi:MAG: transposase [Chthoniobacter sp.]